jgi:hypothetical protein
LQTNPAAYASILSPTQKRFASVQEVQTVSLSVTVVREQHVLRLDCAAPGNSGEFVLMAAGTTAVNPLAYRLTPASTPTDVMHAVAALTTCGSITVSAPVARSNLTCGGPRANGTGLAWTITYNCDTTTGYPVEQPVSVSLVPQAGQTQVNLSMVRTGAASIPLGGSFTLTYKGVDGSLNETTAPISYSASASAIQTALNALPGVYVSVTGSYTAVATGGQWYITFGTPDGPVPLLVPSFAGTLVGTNAAVTVARIQAGSFDPFIYPLSMDYFQARAVRITWRL